MSDGNNMKDFEVLAVTDGEIVLLDELDDQIFAQKMIGDGFAIRPAGNIVYSPVDGVIGQIAPTKHAVYLSISEDIKLLIHVGIDTIEMKGKGFETEYQSRSTYKDGVMKDIKAEMKKIGFTLRADAKRVPGVNGLAVLRLTNAPALLFEIGFIDNKTDNAIFDNKFNEIVNAFVKVIAKWCGLKKKTTEKVVSVPIQSVSISASFREGSYNKTVKITKDNHVRSGRGAQYKKLGLLKKGQKVKVLYILKNSAGNLWGSIDYGNDVGYICLNYAEEI